MLLGHAEGFRFVSPNSSLWIETLSFLSLSLVSAKQGKKKKVKVIPGRKKTVRRNTSVKELYSFVGKLLWVERERRQRLRLDRRWVPSGALGSWARPAEWSLSSARAVLSAS